MMTAEPQAFMRNRDVYELIRERQLAVLPITVVRGRIVKTDAYPSLAEMRAAPPPRPTARDLGPRPRGRSPRQ